MSVETLPSRSVLYVDRCPSCEVRAICSADGLIGFCQNCGHSGDTAGLTINTAWPPRPGGPGPQPVVYYMRFGDRVKIGTTTDLKTRIVAVPCDELLATEPGSYDLEKRRHIQFRSARIYANREWFYLTDELRAHIAGLPRG